MCCSDMPVQYYHAATPPILSWHFFSYFVDPSNIISLPCQNLSVLSLKWPTWHILTFLTKIWIEKLVVNCETEFYFLLFDFWIWLRLSLCQKIIKTVKHKTWEGVFFSIILLCQTDWWSLKTKCREEAKTFSVHR